MVMRSDRLHGLFGAEIHDMAIFAIITERLILRRFTLGDAAVVLELLNEPSFKEFIGDRGVRTIADARTYLKNGPLESYASLGYGVYLAMDKRDEMPIGMCGLFKRGNLEQPDLGFALFARACGNGYATESAQAIIDHARDTLGLPLLSALANPANERSVALIEKLGFRYRQPYRMPDSDVDLSYYELVFQGK
jgi:ribosomal-protein-alanine N-acetyltransferase